jgi:Fe/S biogenesis protein NfuA
VPIEDRSILSITPDAVEAILGIRAEEPDAEELALSVAVAGIRNLEFTYELTFIPVADAGDEDVVQRFEDLPVVVRADSIERLEGAGITVNEGGLAIDNPNTPSPKITADGAGLEGPVADRIKQLLDQQINPAIASHGGFAELVAVEDDTAYLRLGGGCQGCGLAQVTLGQGIEVAILEAVPEIKHVVDVTDHASGTNPYFESAKK